MPPSRFSKKTSNSGLRWLKRGGSNGKLEVARSIGGRRLLENPLAAPGARPPAAPLPVPDDDLDLEPTPRRVPGERLERAPRILARLQPAQRRQRQPRPPGHLRQRQPLGLACRAHGGGGL